MIDRLDCPSTFDREPASFFGGWLMHQMGRNCPNSVEQPNGARGWRERENAERFKAAISKAGATAKTAISPEPPDQWGDSRDQWSARIDDAHPMNSGAHDAYFQAMKMVGNRNSKGALVDLVCWLLQGKP